MGIPSMLTRYRLASRGLLCASSDNYVATWRGRCRDTDLPREQLKSVVTGVGGQATPTQPPHLMLQAPQQAQVPVACHSVYILSDLSLSLFPWPYSSDPATRFP